MSRDEDELVGFRPRVPGEDPRWDGDPSGIDVVDNGAFAEIENVFDDLADPVDVDENPYLPGVTDEDGVPGFRPFVDHSNDFTQAENISDADNHDTEFVDRDELNARQSDEQEERVLGDDFKDHQQQLADAAVGEDGAPVGDLAQLAGVQQAKQEQSANSAPFTNINPMSAFRALLGGRCTVPLGSNPIQVINWVGDDVEAKPVTIAVFPLDNAQATDSRFPTDLHYQTVFAHITWGTRDGLQEAFIDVGTGIQFTVAASVVYVSIGNSVDSTGTPLSDIPAAVAASLGFYTTSKAAPLTLTSYLLVSTGFAQTVRRPNFASHVYFEREISGDAWTLKFQSLTGVTLYERIIGANLYLENPVKLANDVATIVVSNSAGTHNARLMWGLYL